MAFNNPIKINSLNTIQAKSALFGGPAKKQMLLNIIAKIFVIAIIIILFCFIYKLSLAFHE